VSVKFNAKVNYTGTPHVQLLTDERLIIEASSSE